MASMMKFTKMAALAVIAHQERTCQTHSNENINPEMTQYNYAVWPTDEKAPYIVTKAGWHRLTERLAQVKHLNRSDVNVLVEWVIHIGPDVPPNLKSEEEFFLACMRYCEREYGAENICYGIVHVDEETPHLTVGFVPVVKKPLKLRKNASAATKAAYEAAIAAGKTTEEVLDADSVITRKHLQGWHGGLTNYLIEELGYDPAVHTGITKAMGGNMTVKQLKRKDAKWREQRNKKAAAFHDRRRADAGLLGDRKAELESLISTSDPAPSPQAEAVPEEKKPDLNAIIGNADDRAKR